MPPFSWFLMVFAGFTLAVLFLRSPHTSCDTQKKIFTEKYKTVLSSTLGQKKKKGTPEPMNLLYNQCRESSTMGGCMEFFRVLKEIVKDIQKNDTSCVKKILSNQKLHTALRRYTEMMIVAAWRENQNKVNPWGELDLVDLHLYCNLKEILVEAKGKVNWEKLKKSTLKILKELQPQEQKWQRQGKRQKEQQDKALYKQTLFHVSCKGVSEAL